VVQIVHFEKFLEMVLQLMRLVLQIALGGCDILLIGIASFLVVVVVAGSDDGDDNSDSNMPRVVLLPLFATLGAFPSALGGGFVRCCLTATSGCFRIA
jgi:hypothetical protein